MIFLAILAAGYGLDRLGYRLPHVRRPEARLVLGLSALALGGLWLLVGWLCGRSERRLDATVARDRNQRIARLRADPKTFRFATLIEAGQHWSDAHIVYALDLGMVCACAHLQPFERAMRGSGI